MQMHVHGKPNLEFRLLQNYDLTDLELFCNKCKELGIRNNESLSAIKFDKIKIATSLFKNR